MWICVHLWLKSWIAFWLWFDFGFDALNEVETSVTKCPPHGSLRAVFSHKALQNDSHCTKNFQSHIAPNTFVGIARSEVGRYSPALRVWYLFPLWATPFRYSLPHVIGLTVSEYYEVVWLPIDHRMPFLLSWHILPIAFAKGENRVSQVPGASLLTCHALRPRRPIKILPSSIFTVLTSASLTTSSTTTTLISGLNCLREVHLPCGLLDSLCTLRRFRSIHPLTPDYSPTSTQHSVLVSG